jgi:hypothetical protein
MEHRTGSSYSYVGRVCRGVAGLVRFGQGADYRWAAIGRTLTGGDASHGFWFVNGVIWRDSTWELWSVEMERML